MRLDACGEKPVAQAGFIGTGQFSPYSKPYSRFAFPARLAQILLSRLLPPLAARWRVCRISARRGFKFQVWLIRAEAGEASSSFEISGEPQLFGVLRDLHIYALLSPLRNVGNECAANKFCPADAVSRLSCI
jgi:hypothetical protein